MSNDPIAFPYETEHEVRFRDLDAVGHVNNVVYATYCEQCRVRFLEAVLGERAADLGVVVAHLELDYRTPIEGTGTVAVAMEPGDVGDSSFELTYELTYEGEVVATGSSVQVVVDPETGASAPLPDRWRAVLDAEA
ncbi:acyl-CoA thioesterase [Halobellus sp. EA9]|uniref:acyl-CoA thioesterase n=1 Tax=Halobellus sp. EA9 TaxID=3421647 RepID=UPI003EC13E73